MWERGLKRRNSSRKKHAIALLIVTLILLSGFFSIFRRMFDSDYVSPLPAMVLDRQIGHDKTPFALQELLVKNGIAIEGMGLATAGGIIVRRDKEKEVIFSVLKPFDQQVSSLQQVENRLTIEGKAFSRIDLRFDKPVISFRE